MRTTQAQLKMRGYICCILLSIFLYSHAIKSFPTLRTSASGLYTIDQTNTLFRVDPTSGNQTQISRLLDPNQYIGIAGSTALDYSSQTLHMLMRNYNGNNSTLVLVSVSLGGSVNSITSGIPPFSNSVVTVNPRTGVVYIIGTQQQAPYKNYLYKVSDNTVTLVNTTPFLGSIPAGSRAIYDTSAGVIWVSLVDVSKRASEYIVSVDPLTGQIVNQYDNSASMLGFDFDSKTDNLVGVGYGAIETYLTTMNDQTGDFHYTSLSFDFPSHGLAPGCSAIDSGTRNFYALAASGHSWDPVSWAHLCTIDIDSGHSSCTGHFCVIGDGCPWVMVYQP